MRGFGGMMSFVLKDDSVDNAKRVLSSTISYSHCGRKPGRVESLINHPASMTHASIPARGKDQNGLVDSLIRLERGYRGCW